MSTDSIASSDVQTRPLERKYIAEHIASTKLKKHKFEQRQINLKKFERQFIKVGVFYCV